MKEFFSFEIPVPSIFVKNSITSIRKIGDAVVSVDSDLDIISIMFGGVNVKPLLELINGMNYIYEAIEANVEYRRYEKDIEEENSCS